MQIKKTRLKQIIAEEIARFDALTEEEKVEEGLFGNIGRGAFGRRAKSSRRTGGATPTADDTAERAADELEKSGKEVGLSGQGAKAYDQAMASAALMDAEASAKDAATAQRLANDALNNALEISPERLLGDQDFISKIVKQVKHYLMTGRGETTPGKASARPTMRGHYDDLSLDSMSVPAVQAIEEAIAQVLKEKL
jgi:hypothetical protein